MAPFSCIASLLRKTPSIQRLVFRVVLICITFSPGLGLAISHRTTGDTLLPVSKSQVDYSATESGVISKWRSLYGRNNKPNSTYGIVESGIGAVCGLVLGIGFIDARSGIAGSLLYVAGIFFVAVGIVLAIQFFVRLNRRKSGRT